jgi:hypothetical protein
MFIHGKVPKSKQRKVPKAKQAQYDEWLKSIEAMKPKALRPMVVAKSPVATGVFVRETQKIKSLDTGLLAATKAAPKVYTGSSMKGIATMHKSNAVPVFSDEQAKDISSMRR